MPIDIRSVNPENVQQCLEDMGLDFSKYNKFNVNRQKHKDLEYNNWIRKVAGK